MLTIKIKQEPYIDGDNSYESYAYQLKSTIHVDTDADATEVMGVIYKAMIVEGYGVESIANAMYNYSQYLAFEHKFNLKDDSVEEEYE